MDNEAFVLRRSLIFDPNEGFEKEVLNFKMVARVESSHGGYYLKGKILVEMITGGDKLFFIFWHPETQKIGTGVVYTPENGNLLLSIPKSIMDSREDIDGDDIWPPGLDHLLFFVNLIDQFMFEEEIRKTFMPRLFSLN